MLAGFVLICANNFISKNLPFCTDREFLDEMPDRFGNDSFVLVSPKSIKPYHVDAQHEVDKLSKELITNFLARLNAYYIYYFDMLHVFLDEIPQFRIQCKLFGSQRKVSPIGYCANSHFAEKQNILKK